MKPFCVQNMFSFTVTFVPFFGGMQGIVCDEKMREKVLATFELEGYGHLFAQTFYLNNSFPPHFFIACIHL